MITVVRFDEQTHKGYRCVRIGQYITVYDKKHHRQAIWSVPHEHDGKSGWKASREWIDKREQEIWDAIMKVAKTTFESQSIFENTH